MKSQILTKIHKIKYRDGYNGELTEFYKKLLSRIKKNFQDKFNNSVNKYSYEKIKKIKPHGEDNLFPQLKSIFFNNNKSEIPNLIIPNNKKELFTDINIDIKNCSLFNNNIIISNPTDKANVLAKHLADINNTKLRPNSEGLERIVTNSVNKFKLENNTAIKKQLDPIISKIVILFNNLLNNGYFPSKWKIAMVAPILKKDENPNDIGS